ncbi:hypothetical protein H257_09645 [Aphanomyces astaci]|uniref:Myb/SANT-like domain-containing protein n=1 Tax=Aphanomyces astaci TaxID=112090 RepID=W4GA14_APHAT|nr:hypothetical protein H257_09645 [Aphanomyces astaci]ETV76111.1 hypothetical protein H257_09645 [Aphanomyces astaci]|eukprot:XP_009834236.1 hypothetical protein H257_09645 [Aphanomyces astaci]
MSLWINDMENELLSKAWVAASEDPIKGSGQTLTTFWDTVTHRFNEIKPERRPQRTARALESKFADIKHVVSKCGKSTLLQDHHFQDGQWTQFQGHGVLASPARQAKMRSVSGKRLRHQEINQAF